MNESEKDMKNSSDRGGCGRGARAEFNNCFFFKFLQNNSKFKNKLKHANLGRCKFISVMNLYRDV